MTSNEALVDDAVKACQGIAQARNHISKLKRSSAESFRRPGPAAKKTKSPDVHADRKSSSLPHSRLRMGIRSPECKACSRYCGALVPEQAPNLRLQNQSALNKLPSGTCQKFRSPSYKFLPGHAWACLGMAGPSFNLIRPKILGYANWTETLSSQVHSSPKNFKHSKPVSPPSGITTDCSTICVHSTVGTILRSAGNSKVCVKYVPHCKFQAKASLGAELMME